MRWFASYLFPGLNIRVIFLKEGLPGVLGNKRTWSFYFKGTKCIFGMNLREQGVSLLLKGSLAINFLGIKGACYLPWEAFKKNNYGHIPIEWVRSGWMEKYFAQGQDPQTLFCLVHKSWPWAKYFQSGPSTQLISRETPLVESKNPKVKISG